MSHDAPFAYIDRDVALLRDLIYSYVRGGSVGEMNLRIDALQAVADLEVLARVAAMPPHKAAA